MDGNTFAFERGGVIAVPRLEIADFKAELVVVSTRQLLPTGAFAGPGFIRRRCATWSRSVGIPAGECVRMCVRKVRSREPGASSGAFLFDQENTR